TLTLRLMMNMMVGHLLLVLFFAGTQFFFFSAGGLYTLFGVGTLAFGFVFTLFEVLIAVLQAFIFAILTAVYIQLALLDDHWSHEHTRSQINQQLNNTFGCGTR